VPASLFYLTHLKHRHYRELVKPADAEKWFNFRPQTLPNVLTLATANVLYSP
jgi:hypothetical protein